MKCSPTVPNPEGPFYRPGAVLDVWQADAEGRYGFETVFPGASYHAVVFQGRPSSEK